MLMNCCGAKRLQPFRPVVHESSDSLWLRGNRFALTDSFLNIPRQAQCGMKIELGSELEKTDLWK